MMSLPPVAVRWTIGDVSPRGFEALRMSIWGAWKAFGSRAHFVVVVNTVTCEDARARTGAVPEPVDWQAARGLPEFLRSHLDAGMAEGVAWKLAPPRVHPDRWELPLDNDCILWGLPSAIRGWIEAGDRERCVLEQDVKRCLGQFDDLCGPDAYNTGIRGLPPGFRLEAVLQEVLRLRPAILSSELDEQGLQAAAMSRRRAPGRCGRGDDLLAVLAPLSGTRLPRRPFRRPERP